MARTARRVSDRRAASAAEPGPTAIVVYLCQEPAAGETRHATSWTRLRPLAQRLRTACGALDVPVLEALCISDGRFWSYCCPDCGAARPRAAPMVLPGTSVMAAAAAYAGIQVRGTLKEMGPGSRPGDRRRAAEQEKAPSTPPAGALVPRILDGTGPAAVGRETLDAGRADHRTVPPGHPLGQQPGQGRLATTRCSADDEAAGLILGLQDRATRDRAAEWMEGDEAARALRLWRALARRCVGAYGEHAAAPLTLAGWVCLVHRGRTRGPGRPRPGPAAPTPNTSSPGCCTRPATKASTPRRRCCSAEGRTPAGRREPRPARPDPHLPPAAVRRRQGDPAGRTSAVPPAPAPAPEPGATRAAGSHAVARAAGGRSDGGRGRRPGRGRTATGAGGDHAVGAAAA